MRNNFEEVLAPINGTRFKELAQRKVGLLQAKYNRIEEQILDIKRMNLPSEGKKLVTTQLEDSLTIIEKSITFCRSVIDFVVDSETYKLSLLELNFLASEDSINYQG